MNCNATNNGKRLRKAPLGLNPVGVAKFQLCLAMPAHVKTMFPQGVDGASTLPLGSRPVRANQRVG